MNDTLSADAAAQAGPALVENEICNPFVVAPSVTVTPEQVCDPPADGAVTAHSVESCPGVPPVFTVGVSGAPDPPPAAEAVPGMRKTAPTTANNATSVRSFKTGRRACMISSGGNSGHTCSANIGAMRGW
jgi:hypothetical protein